MRALLMAAAAFTLVACGQTTTPPEPSPAPAAPATREEATAQDTCGASGFAGLVGANVAAVTIPAETNHRIVAPDTMVTEDFNPNRVNFITDANGVITAVECY